MEAALTQTRRPSTDDCVKVKSPTECGRPQQPASVKSTAASAGDRRPRNQGRVYSSDNSIERFVAPAAIERALSIYRQLQEREWSVVVQARKILTQHIYAMIDQGENDEHRLTVGGLVHLKSVERDHAIKSASDSQNCKTMKPRSSSAHSQSLSGARLRASSS
jgi:hypothetical protein